MYCVVFDRDFYYLQVESARVECGSHPREKVRFPVMLQEGFAVTVGKDGPSLDKSKLLKMKPSDLGARHIFCFDGCKVKVEDENTFVCLTKNISANGTISTSSLPPCPPAPCPPAQIRGTTSGEAACLLTGTHWRGQAVWWLRRWCFRF